MASGEALRRIRGGAVACCRDFLMGHGSVLPRVWGGVQIERLRAAFCLALARRARNRSGCLRGIFGEENSLRGAWGSHAWRAGGVVAVMWFSIGRRCLRGGWRRRAEEAGCSRGGRFSFSAKVDEGSLALRCACGFVADLEAGPRLVSRCTDHVRDGYGGVDASLPWRS